MGREALSRKQAISLITLFLIGDTLIFAIGSEAKKSFWLAIILAGVFAIPLIFVFLNLYKTFPDKTLLEINEALFGRLLGKFLNLLFLIFVLQDVISVLRSFGEFVITVGFPETPMAVPIIFIIILSIWASKEGIEVLGRYSQFFLIPVTIFITLAYVLLIPNMNINNIRPLYYIELVPLMQGTISAFTFVFGEIIIVFMVFKISTIRDFKESLYYKGVFFAGLIIFITSLTQVLVLGINAYSTTYFPSYETVSRIRIGDFLQSLELIVAIIFVLATFLKISFCIYVVAKSTANILNFDDYRFFVTPLGLMIINLSLVVYRDIMHLFQWAEKFWTYFALPFELFLPILIFVIAKIKCTKSKAH